MLDWFCSLIIKDCDVLISMSGMSLRTIRRVQAAFGAACFLERSSQHIEAQKQILDEQGAGDSVAEWTVRRELLEYDAVHKIVVLSSHCVESFLERGIPADKLRRLSLGVDLGLFQCTPTKGQSDQLRVLFVGTWCFQKGCDLLEHAVLELEGIQVSHVGALGDLPFPEDSRFVHHDPVQEEELPHFYQQSDVFVLPSRQDGFGMVLLQALASGRCVITSDLTGGPDLVKDFGLQGIVRTFDAGSAMELANALRDARDELRLSGRLEGCGESIRNQLGWNAYAGRYAQMMVSEVEQSR
ncbi:glycosyltransferase family 4 protein [Planctomycetota bacterium]|nr:glycosyltransferase family 4 protein [Planctomycetota bacterium]